ncbi:MAG TPA: Spy/CpxP family protein refolding chaperone [bacterium]|nr:Spy/CpxP family protein refolding chaperone [bacterium]
MNKMKLWMVGGLLASLAAYPLMALADDAAAPAPDGNGPLGGRWMEKMKDKLGLTDAQVDKLKQLAKDQRSAVKPLRHDLKDETKTLADKLKAGAGDSDLKRVLDKIDQDRQALDAARQKNREALRGILTPTQQAKAYLAMAKRGMGRMDHWKKGGNRGQAPDAAPDSSAPPQGSDKL